MPTTDKHFVLILPNITRQTCHRSESIGEKGKRARLTNRHRKSRTQLMAVRQTHKQTERQKEIKKVYTIP